MATWFYGIAVGAALNIEWLKQQKIIPMEWTGV